MRRSVLIVLVLAYVSLLIFRAVTFMPHIDEAWYALPAWNLSANGSFGSPVVSSSGPPAPGHNVSLVGIHEHTYWLMPLLPLAEAGWASILGFSLLKLRLLAILMSFVLLAAWYAIVYGLSDGNRLMAGAAVAVIAIDETFIKGATLARPDMLAAAFGYSGIAFYLMYRGRSMPIAVFVSNLGIAAAAFTHPNAAVICLSVLIALVLMLDRHAIRVPLLALAICPYLIAAGAYGLYIAQDPNAFHEQFFSNANERFAGGIVGVILTVVREPLRYVYFVFESKLALIRLIRIAIYVTAFLYVAITFKHRSNVCQRLLVVATVGAFALALVEVHKDRWTYLPFTTPALGALTVAAYYELKQRIPRWVTLVAVAALLFVSVGNTLRIAVRDWREPLYHQTVAFVNQNAGANSTVMASAEFFFALGAQRAMDDIWLGYFSGIRPNVIVLGPPQDGRTVVDYHPVKPEIERFVKTRLEQEFHLAYSNRLYRVYLPAETAALR